MAETDWNEVAQFFNGVIEEANYPTLSDIETSLTVEIYSPALDQTLSVVVPTGQVEDFLKRLSLYRAEVKAGK